VRIAAIEGPLGPTIQIFDDDVVAFTRLIDLTLLLISTTFPYLCDCRLGNAEVYHADGNCHSNECNSDAAQSLLPDVHGLSVQLHRNARAPLPGDVVTPGPLARGHRRERFAPAPGLARPLSGRRLIWAVAKALDIGRASGVGSHVLYVLCT
jgi:hypothetical protein